MGYSEAYCHLCGVSFNICRARDAGEGELATYSSSDGLYGDIEDVDLGKCAENACMFALRNQQAEEDDVASDPDYEPPESDDDYEPCEYDSDYESGDAMSLCDDEEDDEETTNEQEVYREFLVGTLRHFRRETGEPVGAIVYSPEMRKKDTLIPITSDEFPEGYEPEDLEHMPSRTCSEALAYHGSAISLLEMRGCRTAQFLVHKGSAKGTWQPDGLHESWETTEDWFLSGVSDGMESRDCGFPTVWPARGGLEFVHADNVNFDPRHIASNDIAMPFHPWCFDIFSRQSKVHFGKVNVDGLMKWRNAESDYNAFNSFPRSRDVFEAQEQWWNHSPGKEYLAANPLYVPGLPAMLFGASQDATSMDYAKTAAQPPGDRTDRLSSLPLEVYLHIISFLESADITSLRATSKAFTHLPNGVWYRFVRVEMPWLWEAWDENELEHTPSWWATVTANEVKYVKDMRERYREVLKGEDMPSHPAVDYLFPWPSASADEIRLPRATTDWHRVYTQIKSNWGRLKGLRNRQRIWEDVEEVMRRIKKYDTQ
ncbi:F-box protein [Aspergillus lucknowensis]|uniref:F-box domain-containing protein n=1 Tax=Aspergillus lucknowensis TaxID=176173 RepID=A0ABR4M4S3_9EURO